MLIGLLIVASSLALALVLPVLSFLRATRAERDVRHLALEVVTLRREIDSLRAAAPADSPVRPADPAWHDTVQALQRAAPATDGAAPVDAAVPPPPGGAAPGLVPDAGAPAAAPAADESSPVAPPALPVPPPLVTMTSADALEHRIGARWLLYAGMAALLLGISYFITFAFDNGWVSEPLRVAVGLGAGVALLAGGLRFSRQGVRLFGHVLAGGGIVSLYLALYAALHAYELIAPATAFVAMVLVTGTSAFLAHRERAQALAIMALVGGFVTPYLVGGGRDAQLVLFTYVALLLAGSTVLGLRHAWPMLHALGYLFTCLIVAAWGAWHYAGTAWLRTEIFLTIYAVLFLYAWFAMRRVSGVSVVARLVSWVLATSPIVYHLASVTILAPQPGALLVYFVLFTVAGLSISHHTNLPWLRSAVVLLAGIPLMAWMNGLRRPGWYPGAVITACALYGLHLAGQWRAVSDDDAPAKVPLAEVVHTHLNGLVLPATLYMFLDDRAVWWNPPMLTVLAAWNGGIAWVTRQRVETLPWQFAALAATLAAVAIGVWFDGPAAAVGWAMEAAALGWLAVSRQNRWLGTGSAVLFVIGALRLLEMLGRPLAVTSWPVANTRTLAAALVVGAALWVAHVLRRTPTTDARLRHVLIVGAHVLAIAWMSAEITALFGQRAYAASAADRPVGVARAELFEQVALSVAWACYAVVLIAAGIVRRYAPARYLGIALFGLTIVKVMTRDIAELDRVYQMLSVLGVGGLLLLASYLYQRMARAGAHDGPDTAAID